MKCAIYARYSSDLQKDTSIEDQIRNCRKFAEQKQWLIVKEHVYVDEAVSGSSLTGRVQLSRLVKAATSRACPFNYIIIDDTSRLSRDRIDQANIIEEFHTAGVYLYFVSQNIDTADEQSNDVVLPIHGIVDSLYLKELGKKTHRGMEGRFVNGYNAGGRTYGYQYRDIVKSCG